MKSRQRRGPHKLLSQGIAFVSLKDPMVPEPHDTLLQALALKPLSLSLVSATGAVLKHDFRVSGGVQFRCGVSERPGCKKHCNPSPQDQIPNAKPQHPPPSRVCHVELSYAVLRLASVGDDGDS